MQSRLNSSGVRSFQGPSERRDFGRSQLRHGKGSFLADSKRGKGRDTRLRAKPFASLPGSPYGPPGMSAGLNGDAQAIQHRVQTLSTDELHERYHELVDKRLAETVHYTELLELDLIEVRLETGDKDELNRVLALQADWRQQRDTLVISIEQLLARLRARR